MKKSSVVMATSHLRQLAIHLAVQSLTGEVERVSFLGDTPDELGGAMSRLDQIGRKPVSGRAVAIPAQDFA